MLSWGAGYSPLCSLFPLEELEAQLRPQVGAEMAWIWGEKCSQHVAPSLPMQFVLASEVWGVPHHHVLGFFQCCLALE